MKFQNLIPYIRNWKKQYLALWYRTTAFQNLIPYIRNWKSKVYDPTGKYIDVSKLNSLHKELEVGLNCARNIPREVSKLNSLHKELEVQFQFPNSACCFCFKT